MNRGIYSIKDIKIGEYMNLLHLKNAAEAERYFLMLCGNPQAPMFKAPKDYAIHELGNFDTDSGTIMAARIPRDVTPHSAVDMAIRESEAAAKNATQSKS